MMRRDSMNSEAPLSLSHSSYTLLYLLKLARDFKLKEQPGPDATKEVKKSGKKTNHVQLSGGLMNIPIQQKYM